MLDNHRPLAVTIRLSRKGSSEQDLCGLFVPGPGWRGGKTSREQPCWSEHAACMDKLFDEGVVVLGGPFADEIHLLVIVDASNQETTQALFEHDPFMIHRIVHIHGIHEWLISLDARQKSSPVG